MGVFAGHIYEKNQRSRIGVGNLLSAKSHLDIYNILGEPHKIVSLVTRALDILNFKPHLQLPWHSQSLASCLH